MSKCRLKGIGELFPNLPLCFPSRREMGKIRVSLMAGTAYRVRQCRIGLKSICNQSNKRMHDDSIKQRAGSIRI